MIKRVFNYFRTMFRGKAESLMKPEIELEMAIDEAKKQDKALRGQAASVIAHRTKLEERIENSADDVADAKELTKQAIIRAERAKSEGDAEAMEKWTNSASSLAMRLQASENNLDSLKEQYTIAVQQSDGAKSAVEQNAMRVQELAAKRLELLGKLEQAKMQETLNKAVETMSEVVEVDAPSLASVEEKISNRLAQAKAKHELRGSTPEGAEAELREAVSLSRAEDKLAELRAELGLGSSGELPSGS